MRLQYLLLLFIACFSALSCAAVTAEVAKADVANAFSAEQEKAIESTGEKFEFQAEVNRYSISLLKNLNAVQDLTTNETHTFFLLYFYLRRLMDIIINSLYKNKEVFLRELISNASDALDKIRFLALAATDALGTNRDLEIRISFDEEKKTLTIRDTGVGMSRTDLVNNLGTVAKSGTSNFVEALSDGGDMGLIGQFGVGFYSVYLIADKVRVVSKKNEDDQYVWESTADSSFSVSKDPRGNTLGRGTEITMYLKEDAHEFLQQSKLEELVKRYSEFITFPIQLYMKTQEVVEEEDEETETEDEKSETAEDDITVEDEVEEKDTTKTGKVDVWGWHRVNNNVAIWSRENKDISEEEYQKFYKAISKETSDAQSWIHFKAEGEVEFKCILFVPGDATGLYEDYNNRKAGMKLYVRKVLIQEDFEDLLPRYLNFLRGVVDSDDLPLNVSRETLQQHRVLKVMAKKLVRKALEMLRKLADGTKESDEDEEGKKVKSKEDSDAEHPYIKFWNQFGKSIKMGVIEDTPNRNKLAKLLRFKSSTSDDKLVSLEEYVASMPDWQQEVYFIAGESLNAVKRSPFLEVATKKKVQVLYLVEPIDEYVFQHLGEFDGHKLQSLTKEGLKFADENEEVAKKRTKAYKDNFKPLTKYMKDLFAGKVNRVTVSQRVEKSPSVIVTSQYGHTANMERLMRAQTFTDAEHVRSMAAQRTLELNPRHPIVVELNRLITANSADDSVKDLAFLLYDTALLASGFAQDDTDGFSDRMYRTMAASLNIKSLKLVEELEIDEEEEDIKVEDLKVPAAVSSEEDSGHDEF